MCKSNEVQDWSHSIRPVRSICSKQFRKTPPEAQIIENSERVEDQGLNICRDEARGEKENSGGRTALLESNRCGPKLNFAVSSRRNKKQEQKLLDKSVNQEAQAQIQSLLGKSS